MVLAKVNESLGFSDGGKEVGSDIVLDNKRVLACGHVLK